MNKYITIIFAIVLTAGTALLTGCNNNESKAQAMLVEAISYSEGVPPKDWDTPLKIADTHGFKKGYDMSDRELVMVAGRVLCDDVLKQYPKTQSAIKAAELKQKIDDKLRAIANERIRAQFGDN